MKTKVLFLLLVVFAISCQDNSSPLIEEKEEETHHNPFAIAPEKAKAEALQLVFAGKPLSKSAETLTSDIQTVWRTLTISPSTSSSVTTRSQSEYTELVPVYIITFKDGDEDAGFVVTVGDSRVLNRILAFSDEGEWNISEVGDFEDVFWDQVDAYLADVIEENDENDLCDTYYTLTYISEYVKYASNFRPVWGVDPSPYNDSVPFCSNYGTNMLAGCAAVAMGQIMSYHGRPLSGSYTHPRYNRTVTAQYNWTAMKANADASNLSATGKIGVANLLAEAGTKVYMDYGCSVSTAYPDSVPQAFNRMGYTSSSTASYSLSTIINDIDNNRPVFIWGYKTGFSNGHAWIVEGYKIIEGAEHVGRDCPDGMGDDIPPTPTGNILPMDYFLYFNLGWNGVSNGFYNGGVFSTWTYSQNRGIIHNIHPNS